MKATDRKDSTHPADGGRPGDRPCPRARRAGPQDQDELEALRARAFAAWSGGPAAASRADFDDAFQEGWIGLQRTLAAGRPVANWQAYLIESGRNWLCSRHRGSRPVVPVGHEHHGLVDGGAAERLEHVEDEAERLRLATVVRQALAEEFDKRERQMIRLKYELQRSDREIAAAFGLSPRAVKTLFSGKRAQGRLKQEGLNQRLARYVGSPPDESLLCRRRRSQVKALVGGWVMSADRRAQVRTHLDGCEGCRTFARQALGYQQLLPPVALPLGFTADQPVTEMLAQLTQALHAAADKVEAGPATGVALAGGGAGVAAAGAGGVGAAGGGAFLTGGLGAKLAIGCAIAGGTVCVGTYETLVVKPESEQTEIRAHPAPRAGPSEPPPAEAVPAPRPAAAPESAAVTPAAPAPPPVQPRPPTPAQAAAREFDAGGQAAPRPARAKAAPRPTPTEARATPAGTGGSATGAGEAAGPPSRPPPAGAEFIP